MDGDTKRSFRQRHKAAILMAGIAVAIGLWWLFRPEALFINRHVSEMPSGEVASLQPVYTGSLRMTEAGRPTSGRVNILRNGAGLQLEISDFESQGSGPFEVALVASEADPAPGSLGTVTAAGNEKLSLPAGMNPASQRTVLVMDSSRKVIATATLEPF